MGGIKVEKIKSWIVGGSLFDQFNLCGWSHNAVAAVHLYSPAESTEQDHDTQVFDLLDFSTH